jgi:hypothetical protein
VTAELIHGLRKGLPRFAKLDHAWLQIVQRALDKTILLLIVCQQVVPERMLGKIIRLTKR